MTVRTATTVTWEAGQTHSSAAVAELSSVIRTEALRKVFRSGQTEITPLACVDMTVDRGELVSIVGPSGAGKSTLLHLLAALDTPTSGTVYCAGIILNSLSGAELAEFRSRNIGFVWQGHHLLPDFTAAENVAMPLRIQGMSQSKAVEQAREWLAEVGLADRAHQPAGVLSGGEQQRVAVARALVTRPAVLLADEPTGDLDEVNAVAIFDLIQRLHRSHRLTSILATHNLPLAERAGRMFHLEHGKLDPAGRKAAARSISEGGTVRAGQ